MKKSIITAITIATFVSGCFAQTVVKMVLPKQADKPLEVVTLFNESLPLNTTIVLGAMGYNISGGTTPYTLTWLKDTQVIATGDIAVIQPVSGSSYSLKVTDKNNCSYTTALNLNVPNKVRKEQTKENKIIVSPTLVKDRITVSFTGNEPIPASVRIFDTQGVLSFQKNITGNSILPVHLPKGNYFVVVEGNNLYVAEKIIVQ